MENIKNTVEYAFGPHSVVICNEMELRALSSERNAPINTLHDMKSMSQPGMDKPGECLTRELQIRVRVPIGAIFTTTNTIHVRL